MNKLLLSVLVMGLLGCQSKDYSKEVQEKGEEPDSVLVSHLEIIDIMNGERESVYSLEGHFEAPNWTPDGKELIYNCNGRLFRIPIEGGKSKEINTDFAVKCNNDHLISSDGSKIAISHHSKEDNKSRIYILPVKGGIPELITPNAPSYLHGWTPDGGTLAYCAERNGNYDIYTISIGGGKERRLTDAVGLDDGPEYSPDGRYIYFNSIRTGTMQIWRMDLDGSNQVQITDDDYQNWFAHISPDNTKMVYVSYDKSVEGHPANKDVLLRIQELEDGQPEVLLSLYGGQGTINVPSWSPDSRKIAFVRYEFVNE